jgi:hypothetical protein
MRVRAWAGMNVWIDRHDQPYECDVMVKGGSLPGAILATPVATRIRLAGASVYASTRFVGQRASDSLTSMGMA